MYSQLPDQASKLPPSYPHHSAANQSYMPYDPDHQIPPEGNTFRQPLNEDNILINISTPLLTLMTQIRHTIEQNNVSKLRALIIEEIKHFEQKLKQIDYPARNIIAARYCLCTALDEAVLSRPWGVQSIWSQESLLNLFHRETWGGERFYMILEDMAKDPRRNIEFLEFAYFLLSLGFEGKFYDQNSAIREEIRSRIFYRIRYSRQKPEKTLSHFKYHSTPLVDKTLRRRTLKRLSWISGTVLFVLALIFNYQVREAASQTLKELSSIGTISPITTFSEVMQRPIVERNMN